jgi:hypothetical protein
MSTPKSIQPTDSAAGPDDVERDAAPGLDQGVQGALGRKLRESYEQVVKEEVPDKFLQLLDQLKRSESHKKVHES